MSKSTTKTIIKSFVAVVLAGAIGTGVYFSVKNWDTIKSTVSGWFGKEEKPVEPDNPDAPLTYTVKFVVDGVESEPQQVANGGLAQAPANPTKEGYTFEGWSIDGENIVNLETYIINEDTTFTAIFKVIETPSPTTYTITFNIDGEETTQEVEEGTTISLPEEPIKEGYTFEGWSIDGENVIDISNYTITENTTFIALFSEIIEESTATSASLFTFDNGTVTGYIGEDTEIVIPSSYSIGETKTETYEFTSKSELTKFCSSDNDYPYKVVDANGTQKTISSSAVLPLFTATYPVTYTKTIFHYIDGDDYQVTSIGSKAFYHCSSLQSITIPNSVTSIGRDAFNGCTSLNSINIPNGVTSIGTYAFSKCTSLTSITIPDSVTSIVTFAFDGCSGLKSIVVDGNNSVYDSRNNCNAIIETSSNTLIAGCKNTIIPDSVTSIGEGAFQNCSSLTSITIPYSVTKIYSYAFMYCSGLNTITIEATTPPTLGTSAIPNNVTLILVPEESVDTYKSASGWSTYADKIIANGEVSAS